MPEPFQSQEAITILRQILSVGDLKIRNHCYIQLDTREADDVDIREVLENNGVIHADPQLDEKLQKWKYLVDGYDTDGEKLQIVVNIDEENCRVVAISAIRRWSLKKEKIK